MSYSQKLYTALKIVNQLVIVYVKNSFSSLDPPIIFDDNLKFPVMSFIFVDFKLLRIVVICCLQLIYY